MVIVGLVPCLVKSWQPVTAQPPAVRKRVVASQKPARMIDNALRQRALEAVERSLASDTPPV